jgi:hypothetical protein
MDHPGMALPVLTPDITVGRLATLLDDAVMSRTFVGSRELGLHPDGRVRWAAGCWYPLHGGSDRETRGAIPIASIVRVPLCSDVCKCKRHVMTALLNHSSGGNRLPRVRSSCITVANIRQASVCLN